ncbi:MAG TPA: hypothetical protein VK614_10875 [Allosphingosinicella sp.]|nr:hypothetical protein [Allosphingosinicella sp.]
MSNLDKTRSFIAQKGGAYVELIDEVHQVARGIETELGNSVILRVYSRADKQGGQKLKDVAKIADAIEGAVTENALRELDDIVGLTIVVQYPDQLDIVADRLTSALAPIQIEQIDRKDLSGAYYAKHVTYRSARTPHQGLRCEVQCKTMLHDAWAAKMHDLTYKPQGTMDPRLKRLVEAISTTLEGLEQQSQIARDIIVARQNVEQRPFQESLKLLHAELVRTSQGQWAARGALKGLEGLWSEIDAAEAGTGELDGREFDSLANRIRVAAANTKSLRVRWILAVRLVAIRIRPERLVLLTDLADMMLDEAADLLQRKYLTQHELRLFPIGFYAVGDFARALEYVDKVLAQADALKLNVESRRALKFNKASWLLERESLRPSKPAVAKKVRAEVDGLLNELRGSTALSRHGELDDTEGLLLIVYGTTKGEVRCGIEMCNVAARKAQGAGEQAIANAYADWRTHAGWRRYFELAESGA